MDSQVGFPVVDAHAHYFSKNTLLAWAKRGRSMEGFTKRLNNLTDMKSIEIPDADMDVGQRWVDEMDRYGIEAMGVMVGEEAYDEFLETTERFPGRFLGYANISPEPGAEDRVRQAARDGFYGIKLYPSAWNGIHVYDEVCYPIYEEADKHRMLVFLHFGITIGGSADLRGGNPLDIQVPARDFRDLRFIVAHFGAGFFREMLMMQYQAENVYMDSSGSNSWMRYMPYDLDLKQIFRKAVQTGGAEKVLFGTDSTFFPRGWRFNVLEAQVQACRELMAEPEPVLDEEGLRRIFRGNILEMTGFKPASGTV